jgi:hypothetical protein
VSIVGELSTFGISELSTKLGERRWLSYPDMCPGADYANSINSIFEVGMGALSTPGAKVVMAGNPTRTTGFFYDTHHLLRDRWHTMHVSCLNVPRAQGHIEDIKAKYGDAVN